MSHLPVGPAILGMFLGLGCATPGTPTVAWPPADAIPAPSSVPQAGVVQASFAEPAPKPGTELLPPPRKVDPDSKQGDVPPPSAPKNVPPVLGTSASVGGPLGLEEVLTSVETHYPLLRAIEQERAIAGGKLLSTMGAFDLNFLAGSEGQGTTYDNLRSTIGLSQGLPVGGMSVFAGYRTGYGEFPTYNLGQKTADGGEFRTGITLPLLKDRAIDRPRAAVQQARIDTAIAEPVIERQRIDFHRAAALTYWNWVAAGHRLKLSQALVDLATERDEQLKARVLIGPAANIERIDNQQNIALRNGLLVQAQRAFQKASIDLSLFLRDGTGSPTLAGDDRLPIFPKVEPVDPAGFQAALQTAFEMRPEPRRLRFQREKAAVDLRLALNQTLPGLNAVLATAQDVGFSKSSLSGPNGLDRTTVSAGLTMQVPLQRREANGRVLTAQAQLIQLEQQFRQAEDVVRADVQDSFSALERAYEFHKQAQQRVELARTVARAEREQLRLGRSDVLRVTLREQAAFEAGMIEIGAQQEYFRAEADFRAALGLAGK